MDLLDEYPADLRRAHVRVEFEVARAEFAHELANRAAAEQWGAFAVVLDEARRSTHVFVDPELPMRDAERIEFAERAAAADLAVRLGMSESTVRCQAMDAVTLRERLPILWGRFLDGRVAAPNARTAAELVRSLPDDPELWARFDAAVSEIAGQAPARFRVRARVLRERIHSIALSERARAAREKRGVWVENDLDGMAQLCISAPADAVHAAFARIDAEARAAANAEGETRTLPQLRADMATDLLVTSGTGTGSTPRVSVAVTVPVLTLLGGDEPGTLDGYGPIDAETARRIAAHAPSFTRLLTHPVTGALIDIDRETYRVPADLKRAVETVDQVCSFPGCGRPARSSDLDHAVDYQYGGQTRLTNLAHLCRHHHRLKHKTRWSMSLRRDGPNREVTWRSPTGHERDADPPPF